MVEDKLSIKADWNIISEGDLKNIILVKYCQTDTVTEGLDLDEIIGEERTALLEGEASVCQMHMKVVPTHTIRSITLITECPKMELLLGSEQEYINTYFGDMLDDFQGTRVYRFDVLISQPNVTETLLKLIPGVQQFWIYGMMVLLKKTTMESLLTPKINLQNVQNILSNSSHKLSPSAEKCKDFLQTYMSNRSNMTSPSIQYMMSMVNANFDQNCSLKENMSHNSELNKDATKLPSGECNNMELKRHIDDKLLEIENNLSERLREIEQKQNDKLNEVVQKLQERIQERLEKIEENQNNKLDKILNLLENKFST